MNKWYIVILIICIMGFGLWYYASYDKIVYVENVTDIDTAEEVLTEAVIEEDTITAYITGEVNNPDVYQMPKGTRINELIAMAGGITEEADIESINLAAYVEDAQQIIINNVNEVVDKNDETTQNNSKLININTADKEELMLLPKVGVATADDIIEYRNKNGGFKNTAEIKNVNGIGDKTYETIKDSIIS